jgi:hypothetical protein
MFVENLPTMSLRMRDAIHDIITDFTDTSKEADERIHAAKEILVGHLCEMEPLLFMQDPNLDDIGVCPSGKKKGEFIGIRLMLKNGKNNKKWFLHKDSVAHVYANTLGENFIVHLRGHRATRLARTNLDEAVDARWSTYKTFFSDDCYGDVRPEFANFSTDAAATDSD